MTAAAGAAIDPTRIGLGARMIALGRTAAAAPGDVNSIFVNPANAAYLADPALSSMYSNLSEDITYNYLDAATPFKYGVFGLAYLTAGSGGFNQTTIESGRVVGTGNSFDYSSSVLCLAYGREIMNALSAGTTLKIFNRGFSGINGGTGNGFDMDLGLLWKPKDNLRVGLSQQNTLPSSIAAINWGTGAKEGIPFNTKLGLNYTIRKDVMLAADLDYASNNPLLLHGGAEWTPLAWLAVRGGLDQMATANSTAVTNYTAGVGLNYRGFSFDYAYYMDNVLTSANSAHYFSLSYAFAPAPVKNIAPPVMPAVKQTKPAAKTKVAAPTAKPKPKKAVKKVLKPKPKPQKIKPPAL